MLHIIENIIRLIMFFVIIEDFLGFLTGIDSIIGRTLLSNNNIITKLIFIIILLILLIWSIQPIIEFVLNKILKNKNLKQLKFVNLSLNITRTISLLCIICPITYFIFNSIYNDIQLTNPRIIEFKTNNSIVTMKIRYKDNKMFYTIKISNFKYPKYDILAWITLSFVDDNDFVLYKEQTKLKQWLKTNNDIEYSNYIRISKEDYKNIKKFSINYINDADSINSIKQLLNPLK